jgi:hypothetical protein
MFENRALRIISRPEKGVVAGNWRKLPRQICPSPDIVD